MATPLDAGPKPKAQSMFYKLRNRIARAIHNQAVARILETPPLRSSRTGPIIASMVCHADVLMYLVAAKSVLNGVGGGHVVALNDGSLTPEDINTLQHHFPDMDLIQIRDVSSKATPKGGCWERLLTCLDLSKSRYVIQVDSDIAARGRLHEVIDAAEANVAFTIGTRQGQAIISFAQAATNARHAPGSHVQDEAERQFENYPDAGTMRYVRGCAGFAGFARGAISRAFIEDFSVKMAELLGPRWSEWGSEQVASNVAVANSPGAVVLPTDRYKNFYPPVDLAQVALVHFIGDHRFSDGAYRGMSRDFIRSALA